MKNKNKHSTNNSILHFQVPFTQKHTITKQCSELMDIVIWLCLTVSLNRPAGLLDNIVEDLLSYLLYSYLKLLTQRIDDF